MMATRAFTFRVLQARMLYNNTRQGYAACSTLKPAGYSFPVNIPAKPMPSSVGMLKSCGFFISVARPNVYFGCEVLSHVPNAWVDVGIVDNETLFKRLYEKVTALLTQLPKAHSQVTSSRSKHPSGQNFYPLNALKGDQA